ncbi:MAG: hypothetical protein J1E00_08270 [Oscillospiraceae bacterium]|nr:hypothetical protein [Oscillospiraceae bacterium]
MKQLKRKRLFVGILSVMLFLTACATTVPLEESREVSEGGAADHSHTLPMENLGAVQDESQASDPQVSEPQASDPQTSEPQVSEPQVSEEDTAVVLPQERETELELVSSFKIGKDGLFQYNYYWPESGDGDPIITVSFSECADEQGNIYIVHDTCVYRVNDGAKFDFTSDSSVWDALALGDRIYLRTNDGAVRILDLTSGETRRYMPSISEESMYSYAFVTLDGKEPLLYSSRQYLYLDIYGNKVVPDGPTVKRTALGNALVCGSRTIELKIDGVAAQAYRTGSGETLLSATTISNGAEERILRSYSESGALLSQYKLVVEDGDSKAHKVTLGAYTFEVDVWPTLITGSDGTIYLLLYYSDHGEVYRILPGYEDMTFSKLTES